MLAMAEPIIHHRNPEFQEVLTRVNANLRYLFQTEGPVLTLTCSGTGGVESTFVSLFSPGDTIIAVNGGKFGERWVKMPRAFGLNAVEIRVPWGKAVSGDDLRCGPSRRIRQPGRSTSPRAKPQRERPPTSAAGGGHPGGAPTPLSASTASPPSAHMNSGSMSGGSMSA